MGSCIVDQVSRFVYNQQHSIKRDWQWIVLVKVKSFAIKFYAGGFLSRTKMKAGVLKYYVRGRL